MEIRTLAGLGWEELADAFNAAFADYAVKLTMTPEALAHMQTRRGYVADASYGAFDGGRLVGFVLTCIDGERIYNSGTGVPPEHRRHRLARTLVDTVIARVPHQSYVLEVLTENTGARRLYTEAGFANARMLGSYSYLPHGEPPALPTLSDGELARIAADADVELAWQNSLASLRRATEPHVVLGDERGAVVVFPASGDLPLLVVARAHRRRGHGTRLLAAAAARCGRAVRMINIDQRDSGIANFLAHAGATTLVHQFEMIRPATSPAAS